MKKILIVFMSFGYLTNAYSQAFDKSKKYLSIGIGTGDFSINSTLPPSFHIMAEKGFTDDISAGVFLSVGTDSEKTDYFGYVVTERETAARFGVRGAYHFNKILSVPDNIDIYGGLGAGFRFYRYKIRDNDGNSYTNVLSGLGTLAGSGIYTGVFIGGKYLVNDKMGVYAEVGTHTSWIKAGVSIGF